MKDKDDIIKALAVCSSQTAGCRECPYVKNTECRDELFQGAKQLIESLTAQLAEKELTLQAE